MISFFYDSFLIFFQFLIPGVFLGMIYDIFRLIRLSRRHNKSDSFFEIIKKRYSYKKTKLSLRNFDVLLTFIEDISFFLIVSITEILATYYFNEGEIRIYCLMFSVIGFYCYHKTIGFLVIAISKKLLYLFGKIFCFFIFLIFDPIVFTMKKINKSHISTSKRNHNEKEQNE